MNRIKHIKTALSALLIAVCVLASGCAPEGQDPGPSENNGRLRVIATLFPQYDFAREIAGDKADVTLLLPPGTDSHMFDPSVKDMTKIADADLFIYTGALMEPWAERLIEGTDGKFTVVDASSGMELNLDHSHEEDGHDEGDGHEDKDGEHDHEHEADPHIWLDLSLACVMADNIADGLSQIDQENAGYYRENAENYKKRLIELDGEFKAAVAQGKKDTLVFAGPFAYSYFFARYGLKFVSVYDFCSSEAEPSVGRIKEVVDYIEANKVELLFVDESGVGRVAKSIAEQTGVQTAVFHTCHNRTPEEDHEDLSYIELMRRNLEAVKRALG